MVCSISGLLIDRLLFGHLPVAGNSTECIDCSTHRMYRMQYTSTAQNAAKQKAPIKRRLYNNYQQSNKLFTFKMKKVLVSLLALVVTTVAVAQESIEFAYEAGAELTSAYLWRGQYNGGLSFQPEALVGFDTEHTSFRIGAWASLGASDWKFRKATDDQAGTEFYPEVDIEASFTFYGLTLGATHYYYGDGNFFNWKQDLEEAYDNSSQTEVQVGYNFGDLLDFPLYINWYTMVAGADIYEVETEDEEDALKRAYSSYIELGYDFSLPCDITLGVQVGMTPWKSFYTDYEGGFAVNNVSARIEKPWSIGDVCEISLFAQGSINTYKMTKDNVFISGVANEKLYQRLNGCVGVGIWF